MTMDLVFATTTMRVELPTGGYGVIQKGTHWPADDPIVQAHPQAFSPDPRYGLSFSRQPAGYDAPVEQATAAPGEKRMTARPKVDEAFDEADSLRSELTRLGRDVDGRWSLRRLREEMEKVSQ
jgi:hypothetical protein